MFAVTKDSRTGERLNCWRWRALNLDVAAAAALIGGLANTGVVGSVIGRGYGRTKGRYGMACNSILEAEIVTVDSEILQVGAQQHSSLLGICQ